MNLDLAGMSDGDLRALLDAAEAELARRAGAPEEGAPPAAVRVELETVSSFDARKHGHAYVARLALAPGAKVDREFIPGGSRRWDSKRKYYAQEWDFEAPIGAILEARLNDGSWKNDYRVWYRVDADGPTEVSQAEAHELLKGGAK